jgi:putative flippase GtrA
VDFARGLVERFRGKFWKFAGVSLFGTVMSQVLIWWLHGGRGLSGVEANIIAVCVTAVPAFLLNKRWVWSHTGAHSVDKEMLPFWLLSMAGLVLSTLFVWIATAWVDASWMVSAANLAGFGVLWVLKFWMLDRFLFGQVSPDDDEHHHAMPVL